MMTNTSNVVLKACPFCGDTRMLQTDKIEADGRMFGEQDDDTIQTIPQEEWFVSCGMCVAVGPIGVSAEDAQTRWNRRV